MNDATVIDNRDPDTTEIHFEDHEVTFELTYVQAIAILDSFLENNEDTSRIDDLRDWLEDKL